MAGSKTFLTPTCSVIISVYSDLEALQLIIDSLLHQSLPPNEIIVAEDSEHNTIKTYLQSLENEKIIHLCQPDIGWQKEKILNKAINASSGEYLIFIDGDCVPYKNFVESHLALSQKNTALCGRRTEPGKYFSTLLRQKKLLLQNFKKNYLYNFFVMSRDHIRHYDEGIDLGYNSLLFRLLHTFTRKETHIVGCNWSCYKEDMVKINGFDEDFTMPTHGEDSDVERRLRHFGVKMRSCRNAAIVVHLYHKKVFNEAICEQAQKIMQSKKNIFICKNGLKKETA
jgi:GT2 family glycosyltransferase